MLVMFPMREKKNFNWEKTVDKYTYHLVYVQMKASDNKKLLSLIIIMVLERTGRARMKID